MIDKLENVCVENNVTREKSGVKKKWYHTLALTAVLALSFNSYPALADDDTSSAGNDATSSEAAPSDATADTTTSTDTSKKPMQASVQKVELSLQRLKEVALDLKGVLKAASSLYDEVTIQPVRMITQPEIVGRGIIINIPIGTEPVGPVQPARKERVDMAMNNIRPVISMMKKNVDAFVSGHAEFDLPESVLTELQPQFDEWAKGVNDMAAEEAKLEELTKAPPYNQPQIAARAVDIQRDVKVLDETRRKIYKIIRKEGKKIAEAKKDKN